MPPCEDASRGKRGKWKKNNEERQILAKNSRRLFDEIEELYNLINS